MGCHRWCHRAWCDYSVDSWTRYKKSGLSRHHSLRIRALNARRPTVVLLLLAGAEVLSIPACTSSGSGTTLVVSVYSDLTIGDEIDAIDVIVAKGELRYLFSLGSRSGQVSLPIHVALIPGGKTDQQFVVQAEGLLAQTLVVSQSAAVSFVPGTKQEIVLFLNRDCQSVPRCNSGFTCQKGSCIPEESAGIQRPFASVDAAAPISDGPPVVDLGSGGNSGSGGAVAGSGGSGGDDGGTGGEMTDQAEENRSEDLSDVPVSADVTTDETTPTGAFVCTHVMGGSAIGQWWPYFEPRLDSAHWQDVSVANAYVESWADPANALWATATASACTTDSLTPDRVLLVTYSATLNSMAMYEASITKAVATIKAKFAGVKRIELLTTLRSPNNQMCPGAAALTVVQPYVDQAVQTVAAQSGGLVTVGPKIAVPDCAAWQGATTNLTPAASMAVGPLYFDYYKDHL